MFEDRGKILSHIAQQSWHFKIKFSGKKQDSLLKENFKKHCFFFFLDPEFDSNCRNCLKQRSVAFSEKSLTVADTFK